MDGEDAIALGVVVGVSVCLVICFVGLVYWNIKVLTA